MDRPVTSKSRGICRYYSSPGGCFAGDGCKFLHGPDEKLSPYDKSKLCKYYARGHCTRGDNCWFRHALPKVTPDDERIQFVAETCCICLEKPTAYGLLTNCSHVFCLECIRQWRSPSGKSPDVVSSGTIKCCPLCRTPSRFVTPSAHFFPNGSSCKQETIDAYKSSMARVPCKYFEETLRTGKPCCPFGIDCFYRHANPDGTPHVFRHGAKHSMNVYRRHRLRGASLPPARFDYDDPVEFLQHIFENPITNLHATLDVIRASLPAIMERFGSSSDPGDLNQGEDEEILDDLFDTIEPPEDDLAVHDEAALPLSTAAEEDFLQSTLDESSWQRAASPTQVHLFPESRVTLPQPARPSSRFSTVVTRQSFIIDISDDEDDEEEEESSRYPSNLTIDSTDLPLLETINSYQPSPVQPSTVLQSAVIVDTDTSHIRLQCEHDVDPPFVTDGRGRVVWSSTRNAGRGTTTEGRVPRYSRAGSTPRATRPSSSTTHLVSDTRGHV